jgi:hypothetical protein
LASKGVTRSGDVYCMSCFQLLQDRQVSKCPGCLSELESEVKAFLCPKCRQVLALGDPVCPKCGLKFKVRTIKKPEPKEDDQFLVKLIEWGKQPGDAEEGKPEDFTESSSQQAGATESPSGEQIRKLAQLKESIKELVNDRSEMLSRMEQRMEAEKARLAEITAMDEKSSSAEKVEGEILALAEEMADITMLQAPRSAGPRRRRAWQPGPCG